MLKHAKITYLYKFLAEAIIVFLLIIPFTFDYYDSSHYLGYIVVIFITGSCFFLLETYNRSIGYFLLVLPISIFLLYLFSFPIGLTILFPVVFMWRYARIRSYKHHSQKEVHLHSLDGQYDNNREKLYLHATLFIAVIDVLYAKEIYVIYYVFLQFIILLTGYLISHIAVIHKQERKQMHLTALLPIPVFLMMGSIAVFYIFDPFRQLVLKAWLGFRSLIIFTLSEIVNIIGFILPDLEKPPLTEEQEEFMVEMQGQQDASEAIEEEFRQLGIDEAILVIIVTCIIIAIIILLTIRAMKNKREQLDVKVQSGTHLALDQKEKAKEGFFKRLFSRSKGKPVHPVRNLVYEFENIAVKNDNGRYPFESIGEWFSRLQVDDVNLATYEKVRYGDLEVTDQEIAELEQQLNAVVFKEKENDEIEDQSLS